MKFFIEKRVLIGFFIILLGFLLACSNKTETTPGLGFKVLVPAYFPADHGAAGSKWDALATEASTTPDKLYAIANPNNGPGISQDQTYVETIRYLQSQGGRVLGYVPTSYGNRDVNTQIKPEIDRWYSWYSVDGIFLDEQANGVGAKESYYQSIYDYIKTKNGSGLVVANPGQNTAESYLIYQNRRAADVICIFENATGFHLWQPAEWCSHYDRSNFCVLSYQTSSSDWKEMVESASHKNIGWVYITDDQLPNPWDTMPSYSTSFYDYVTQ